MNITYYKTNDKRQISGHFSLILEIHGQDSLKKDLYLLKDYPLLNYGLTELINMMKTIPSGGRYICKTAAFSTYIEFRFLHMRKLIT